VEPRVSLVTLGVADLAGSRAFYEALGWRSDSKPEEGVVFFQSGGMVLGLWARDELAKDSAVVDSGGWGGVTLACNVGSPADVDTFLEKARAAGATVPRAGAATFWGGYSGLFIDPDGHPWEVAHNPFWTLSDDGSITLPSAEPDSPEG
jgi:predicted lactoylglutathione lyase